MTDKELHTPERFIRLPADIRPRFEAKLAEYEARVASAIARLKAELPSVDNSLLESLCGGVTSSIYKRDLVLRLLQDGVVDAEDLVAELASKYGVEHFNIENYSNAWGIVQNYCENSGKDLLNSTGF